MQKVVYDNIADTVSITLAIEVKLTAAKGFFGATQKGWMRPARDNIDRTMSRASTSSIAQPERSRTKSAPTLKAQTTIPTVLMIGRFFMYPDGSHQGRQHYAWARRSAGLDERRCTRSAPSAGLSRLGTRGRYAPA